MNRYQVVEFSAPEIEQSQTSLSSIVFTPAEVFVSVIPVPSKNISLEQFVDEIYPNAQTIFAGTSNAQSVVMYEYSTDKTSKVMRMAPVI